MSILSASVLVAACNTQFWPVPPCTEGARRAAGASALERIDMRRRHNGTKTDRLGTKRVGLPGAETDRLGTKKPGP